MHSLIYKLEERLALQEQALQRYNERFYKTDQLINELQKD
jgi:hypothetical protein